MSAEVNLNFVLSLARPAEGQGPLLSWRGLPGQHQLESGSLEAVAKDPELEPPDSLVRRIRLPWSMGNRSLLLIKPFASSRETETFVFDEQAEEVRMNIRPSFPARDGEDGFQREPVVEW